MPGNHDLDRGHIYDMPPPGLQRPFNDSTQVNDWLTDPPKRARALEPFDAYRAFVAGYTGQPDPDYASVLRLDLDAGLPIALLGINSAFMCARHKDDKGEEAAMDLHELERSAPADPERLRRLQDIIDHSLPPMPEPRTASPG